MFDAFENVDQIHDAKPIAGKPGIVEGWLKLAPTMSEKDGKTICDVQFVHGEWSTYHHGVAACQQGAFK